MYLKRLAALVSPVSHWRSNRILSRTLPFDKESSLSSAAIPTGRMKLWKMKKMVRVLRVDRVCGLSIISLDNPIKCEFTLKSI